MDGPSKRKTEEKSLLYCTWIKIVMSSSLHFVCCRILIKDSFFEDYISYFDFTPPRAFVRSFGLD